MTRFSLRLHACSYALLIALTVGASGSAMAKQSPSTPAKDETILPRPISQSSVAYPTTGSGAASVILEITILKDGTTKNISVRQGKEPFASAAMKGVNEWKFAPATRGRLPIDARVLVKIDFGAPVPETSGTTSDATTNPDSQTTSDSEPSVDVVVLGQRSEIGTTFIPIEEARQLPGAFGDPFGVAAIQPGVAPVVSGLPYYYVRGAPPGNVGYQIDGIRVPYLFHIGVGPSVVSPAIVEHVDLYPSAFPAELGRYAGSILAGSTQGLSPVSRGELSVRAFDASGLIEQPIGQATVLAAGRVSYLQPVLNRTSPEFQARYWDYQTRIGYKLGARDEISLFAFGAADVLKEKVQGLTLFDAAFHRLDLRWVHNGENGRTTAAVGVGQDRVLAGSRPDDFQGPDDSGTSVLRTRGVNVRVQTSQKLSTNIRLRAGLDYRADEIDNATDELQVLDLPTSKRTDLTTATYVDLVLQPIKGLELVPGFRLETGLWRDSGYLYPEPRLASRVQLGSRVSWASSLGLVHQLPPATIRGPGLIPTQLSRSVQEAYQVAQTLEVRISESITGHATGFYSRIVGRAVSLKSRHYGAEFFIRRDMTERIGFILSYTLSRSETLQEDNIRRIAPFDRTHLVSATIGIDLGLGIRFGARGYVVTGSPYTVQCPRGGCDADPNATSSSGRLPTFVRADIRLDKRWDFDSGAWLTLAGEWFNATLSEEAYAARWNEETSTLEKITQARITVPSLSLEMGF